LNNIKSVYILEKIFDNISINKRLGIIQYNKKIQKKLGLSINDYAQLHIPIEIEIKPTINKYGKFINIKKDNEKYYHIYFDDKKEEIKRNHLLDKEKVNKIKIIIDHQVKSFKKLFAYCSCVESINFKNFYRINIIDMGYMFYECSSLKELDLSNFITNNVKDMNYMFYRCLSLKELNLSNFNTNNVTNMGHMFSECSSLKELNLSNFNTNNVKYMNSMFSWCSSLKELNLSNFNTNNVKYMTSMFLGCSSLKELNLSNFNTNNVYDMKGMFSRCSNELKNKIQQQYKSIKIHD